MKCLPNSNASFAILPHHKPSLIHHHTPNFHSFFSLRSSSNANFQSFRVQLHRNVFPLRASDTQAQAQAQAQIKTKVELDTVDQTEDLPVQQKEESKLIRVKFQLQRQCKFGEQFFIVGDDPMFGSWDPSEAKPMAWSDGHVWTAQMDIAAEKTIQFKFILKGKKGNITWQPGSDRIIKPWESVNGITVCEDWEKAELQKIVEEQEDMEKPLMSSSSSSSDSTSSCINQQSRNLQDGSVPSVEEQSDSVEEF